MAEIGATLREARMRARIDVSEIEAGTKIRAKYLRALENEEWDLLPGPTFVKSFLRTYGQALGLDGRALVEEYKLHYEHSGESVEPVQQSAAGGRRPGGRRGTANAGAGEYRRGAANAGAGRYRLGRGRGGGGGGGTYRRRGASAAGGAPPRQGPSRAYMAAVSVIGAVIVLLLYALFSGGGNSPTAPPNVPAAGTPHAAKAPKRTAGHGTRSAAAKLASLKLRPTGRVYVCLLADGRVRIPGEIVDPETTLRTYHAKRFELTLGNNAVALVVNGEPFTVPESAQAIGYTITRAGIKPLPPSEQPTCG
jgi:cytoskeleton protein RodZ